MTPPITTVPHRPRSLGSADWVFRAGIRNAGIPLFDLRILHQHVHETRAFGRDLRVTSSFSTASMNCTEIVLLIVV